MEILPGIEITSLKSYHKTINGFVWVELYDGRGFEVQMPYLEFTERVKLCIEGVTLKGRACAARSLLSVEELKHTA